MPKFGSRSLGNLETADVKLQQLFNEVIKGYDCTVLCGHRDKEAQEKAVRDGLSKTHFPLSKHNSLPSKAVDVVPYPIDWNDTKGFYHFGGYVKGIADSLGIAIRWGGDWDKDNDLGDQTFIDLPHFELVE